MFILEELKEGSKVKVKKVFLEGYGIRIGDIGIITKINKNDIGVKLNYGEGVFNIEELNKYFEKVKKMREYKDIEKCIVNNNVVVVILKSGCKGVAKCMPEDVFNEEKGIEIAYKKAKIKEIKKELKELSK